MAAVAADDVVGVDLKLRLAVELGIVRQHQSLSHLLAVGLLSVGAYDDLALEHAARTLDSRTLLLHQLTAGAVGTARSR